MLDARVSAICGCLVFTLFFRTPASFSRLILFDRRGTGACDPVLLDALPPWEGHPEELDAVLDQVGSERAATMAHIDAGPMALVFGHYAGPAEIW